MLRLAAVALALTGCARSTVRTATHGYGGSQPARSAAAAATGNPRVAEALRAYYRRWRGVPYRYGGQDRSGIDCSSFVRQTIDAVESLELPRTTAAQATRGQAIPRRDLEAGDLVFFHTGGYQHVGVYIGQGRFMHASSSHGVTLSHLDSRYWRRHYWQSRRVLAGD